MNTIKGVEYVDNYRLLLSFDDGRTGIVDLEDELYGEIFLPLRQKQFFSQVYANPDTGTIEWSNGADFAPEFLLSIMQPSEAVTAA